ncbi:hypothetical protein AKG98_1934 [Moritella sp. JT01]|uniref:hypothetical protein n=1 Tax=Moritella sp. JT01 TaxID=756698 RepID=UPI000797ECE0|nr:hypothetical protein [Moritella sp. JT01]KXO08337.1 hypothetical protein AKG98_1934 [Moritella sp. JT01]
MEYSISKAQEEIGKRVIVSIRIKETDQEEYFKGFWGTIHSAYEDGLLVLVEGGSDDKYEMLPPDFDFLVPAKHEHYEFMDGSIAENIDYELYWTESSEAKNL